MYNFKLTFVSKPKNQGINIGGVKSPREVRLGSKFRYIFAFFKFNSLQPSVLGEEWEKRREKGKKRKLIVRAPATFIGNHVGSVSDRHRVHVSNPRQSYICIGQSGRSLFPALSYSFQAISARFCRVRRFHQNIPFTLPHPAHQLIAVDPWHTLFVPLVSLAAPMAIALNNCKTT